MTVWDKNTQIHTDSPPHPPVLSAGGSAAFDSITLTCFMDNQDHADTLAEFTDSDSKGQLSALFQGHWTSADLFTVQTYQLSHKRFLQFVNSLISSINKKPFG